VTSNLEHAIAKLQGAIDRAKYHGDEITLEFCEEVLADLKLADDGLQEELSQAYDDGRESAEAVKGPHVY
jgi:hypothetical protein